MPTKFTFTTSGGAEKVIDILYDGAGRKLRKTVTDAGVFQYRQDYVGGIEYRTTSTVSLSLESIYHAEGRVFNTNTGLVAADQFRYEYAIRDHLGNTRLTFTDKNADGKIDISTNATTSEVLQENHYYPFGLTMSGPWMDDAARNNPYQYNGKELNEDFGLGWNDYGARWYDASVGRWWSVDKLADDVMQLDKSVYAYAWNNPIELTDPDGNCPWCLGAIAGAAMDYAMQVGTNLATGKSLSKSLTEVDGTSIAVSAALGATGAGLGAKVAKLAKGAGKVDDVANVGDDLVNRAKDIQNAQKTKIAKDKSTTAVADLVAKDGTKTRVVASSRQRLSPSQRQALKKGEIEVKGKGHAEQTIVNHAKKTGQKVDEVAASRPICKTCKEALDKAGAKSVSPVKGGN